MSIILTIIIFSIVVLIHEGGHFLLARKNGIYVKEFALGMGRPILFKKQGAETLYTIRAFPIGGYCAMLGEDDDSDDPRAFSNKSVRARIEVVVAGVIMNLILGFTIFFLIMSYEGFYTTTVGSVTENYPAYNAGLQVGDEIVALNGKNVNSYNDFTFQMQSTEPTDVTLTVLRDGEKIDMSMDLKYDEVAKRNLMGFSPQYEVGYLRSDATVSTVEEKLGTDLEKAGFFETVKQTVSFITFYFKATVQSLVGLVTGTTGLDAMSGPVGIVSVVGDEYQQASKIGIGVVFESMLSLLGTLSLALAVFNILPFPALDGGRLVFLIIEGITGKPVNPKVENMLHYVGFIALMLLAVVVTFSDIFKLF